MNNDRNVGNDFGLWRIYNGAVWDQKVAQFSGGYLTRKELNVILKLSCLRSKELAMAVAFSIFFGRVALPGGFWNPALTDRI